MKLLPIDAQRGQTRQMRTERQMLATGFASPAQSFVKERLNIHDILVDNETATFFFEIESTDYRQAAFRKGNIIVVDRSKSLTKQCLIVAVLQNEFAIIHLSGRPNQWNAINIKTNEAVEEEFELWGVITATIHRL